MPEDVQLFDLSNCATSRDFEWHSDGQTEVIWRDLCSKLWRLSPFGMERSDWRFRFDT